MTPKSNPTTQTFWEKVTWRYSLLLLLMLGSLVSLMKVEVIRQNTLYHAFADTRIFIGIPNCFDVLSNIPFLIIGVVGLQFCLKADLGFARNAWTVFFIGVCLVSFGSAYYHWNPNNETLVWDRLPMTIGFMGLFVALLGEYVNKRLGTLLLVPAVLIGFASVLYWHFTDDLRFYIWVQFFPLLSIPIIMLLFRCNYVHHWYLLIALGWYILAKLTELYDHGILDGTNGIVSGHSSKHIFAAISCIYILIMLKNRKPVSSLNSS